MVTIWAVWLQDHSNLHFFLLYKSAPGIFWCGLQQKKKVEIRVILSYHCPWQECTSMSESDRFFIHEILMYGGGVPSRVYPRGLFLLLF